MNLFVSNTQEQSNSFVTIGDNGCTQFLFILFQINK